ncbi:hypothetical protein FNH05_08970 [Amycolatopsis rhizosphaerae]|uniref:Uncharacterized protein n=1 Tax=Amycolatopsis rhizosphaerae TaxID=2053003 RepID=A0A558D4A6_9PSEU|nr:hypothetical protein [Amycolatopsis rhizosphaerae]TVT55839.1 hypothetical protein FNH05_08970 [Amycolatopsis rhizosphaerae]
MGYLVACLVGALVGAAELASRYRDRPATLVSVPSAWFYVVLNAAASGVALLLIRTFGWRFGADTDAHAAAVQVLVASLSALALFRSSLFTVRIGGQDIGVGPSTLLITLLNVADRSVDRVRARDRSGQITKIMAAVSFAKAQAALPAFCLALMQNVTPQEQRDLAVAIDALAAGKMTDTQRTYALGLLLMNLVGPKVLRYAVEALKDEIRDDGRSAGA